MPACDPATDKEMTIIVREPALSPLTPRQVQILQLLVDGLNPKQIAVILHISKWTVRQHARQAMRRLGASNHTQAVAFAMEDKIVSVSPLCRFPKGRQSHTISSD